MNTNTAQAILDQIKVLDPFLLTSVGARDFVSSKPDGKHKGFLQFKVSHCYKVSRGTNVRITLEYNDTYSLKTFILRKVPGEMDIKEKVFEEITDVHAENLVEAIDTLVG